MELLSVKNRNPTKGKLDKEIYKAFVRQKSRDIGASDILSEINIDSTFNPRFEFPSSSIIKSLILMRLKGIKSQSKLAEYLETHENDAIKLGFFRDRNNKVKTPDQRTFSYFIKNHMDDNRNQLIDFVSRTIVTLLHL